LLWSPNTQLHYPFENQANDYSGHARHGTINGSRVFATKPNGGRCLYFDGVGDYVSTPSFGLSGTVVVFAADMRCTLHASQYQPLLASGNQSATVGYLGLLIDPNSYSLDWQYANGSIATAGYAVDFLASPFNDAWLSLVVICDYTGKFIYFYRNAMPFSSPVAMSGTPVFPSTTNAKNLGYWPWLGLHYLTYGYMRNVQLWTLATMPPLAVMTANANRLMLGLNPIWSV